jgi:hypothetical protein
MACRSFPPFYEEEKAGVCVPNPPKAESTTKDSIILLAFFAGIIGLFYYATKSKSL